MSTSLSLKMISGPARCCQKNLLRECGTTGTGTKHVQEVYLNGEGKTREKKHSKGEKREAAIRPDFTGAYEIE